jgi:hypothetical protein
MSILLKLVIAVAVVGLLRCSQKFREMSRELDEAVFHSLKRIMHVTEESGYPRETILLLIVLTAVAVLAMTGASAPPGR